MGPIRPIPSPSRGVDRTIPTLDRQEIGVWAIGGVVRRQREALLSLRAVRSPHMTSTDIFGHAPKSH